MLTELIARYADAKKVWEAQFDHDCDSAAASPEWRLYMSLSLGIINFPCSTIEQVRQKALLILTDENLIDLIARAPTDRGMMAFLKSMLGSPVDSGGN